MAFYTLTATCRRLHLDPPAYLRDAFERLPSLSGDAIVRPLPDRWLAAHLRHLLTTRAQVAAHCDAARAANYLCGY